MEVQFATVVTTQSSQALATQPSTWIHCGPTNSQRRFFKSNFVRNNENFNFPTTSMTFHPPSHILFGLFAPPTASMTPGPATNVSASATQSLEYYTTYRFPSQCVGQCGANATSSPFMGLAALNCGRPGDVERYVSRHRWLSTNTNPLGWTISSVLFLGAFLVLIPQAS